MAAKKGIFMAKKGYFYFGSQKTYIFYDEKKGLNLCQKYEI